MKIKDTFKTLAAFSYSAAISALLTTPAQAVPILAENSAQRSTDALTLYPDSNNPNLFYFMPNSSTFARDADSQLPAFGFTYWGLSNHGPTNEAGAYWTFTLRLISDASQKAALDAFLKNNPGKGIAVLPVASSTVGLSSTAEGARPLGRMFEEFNFSRVGGRAEDEVGVNAVLSGVGARAFRSAIENPQSIKIDYCYQVLGLSPQFNASIVIDWEHTYHEFEAQLSTGGFFTRANIGATVERLKQDNHIEVHINGGDAKDEEYVNAIRDQIIARLFKQDLSNTPGAKPTNDAWSFTKLSLNYTDRKELKTERFDMTRRKEITREFCTPMRLGDIAAYKDRLVKDADAAL